MKIIWLIVAVLAVVYAANGKPTTADDDYFDYANQMLKDTEDEDEYDNADDDNEDTTDDTPPSIVTKSREFFPKVNETLLLPCEVLNGENHVIMWKKNDTILYQDMIPFGSAEKNKYERLKNGTLVIKNLDSSDTGEYICSIPLENQDKLQVMHHVYVETPPRILSLSTPNNLEELKVGDNLVLICKAIGIPKPKINWYFKNKLLVRRSDETLEIDNIDFEDAGEYRCLADNNIGTPAHSTTIVNFKYKPVVTIKEVRSNSTIQELLCESNANPPVMHMKWKLNGTAINSDQNIAIRHKNNVLKLSFEEFNEANFGQYTCIARNELGKTEQTVRVDLMPKQPQVKSVTPSHKYFEILWTVLSTLPLTDNVVEYKNEKDDEWKTAKPEEISLINGMYTVGHNFTDLPHGKYVAKLVTFNEYGASEPSKEEKFVIKGHSKHHHNDKIRTYFEAEPTDSEKSHAVLATPNESVLNDQEDAAQTGSRTSTAIPNAVPSLLVMFLLGVFLSRH